MKTTKHTSRSTFTNARMPPEALCLAKASEPQVNLGTADSVRLSRPGVFRETGEVLVKDEQEGRARTSTPIPSVYGWPGGATPSA